MSQNPLELEVLLTESMIADRFLQSLGQRILPELFFYWFPLSVRAWVALCRDSRYRNYLRSETLLKAAGKTVADSLTDRRVEVISLGAGQGTKDRLLLAALVESGRQVIYRPVDAGHMLLEMACEQGRELGVSVRGLKADLTDPTHLAWLKPRSDDPPRIITLLGNTLGAFDPAVMLGRLRTLVREEDRLVIDGELGNDEATRLGYEHPANQAFAFAPLRSIGLTERDGALLFQSSNHILPGVHRLEKHFRFHADRSVLVAGERLEFKAGDSIHMNHSGKFEREAFCALLTEAGFSILGEEISDDERFMMVNAKPRP
jgi:uncharacterized SAM-dependent methyltransferase